MVLSVGGGLSSAGLMLAALPGVGATQAVDTAVIADVPAVVRPLASLVLVGLIGTALLRRCADRVDQAVADTMDRPAAAVLYGAIAFGLVSLLGLYATTVLAQIGLARTSLGALVGLLLAGGLAVLGSFGFLVVGTLVTDVTVGRHPRQGLLLGAALSGVCWLMLPVTAAVPAWLLIAAIGVGGSTRKWIHSERTVESAMT